MINTQSDVCVVCSQGERGEGGPPGPAGFAGPPVSITVSSHHLGFTSTELKCLCSRCRVATDSRVLRDSPVTPDPRVMLELLDPGDLSEALAHR